MTDILSIRAGNIAFEQLKDEGLKLEHVKIIAGASGAAKFLVLTGMDRILMKLFAKRDVPLHLIGTSIGAFRMAAYCNPNPQESLNQLEEAYIAQHYANKPSKQEVTNTSQAILNHFIADEDVDAILKHPAMKLNFLTNRCKGLAKFENNYLQMAGLGIAALTNYFRRDQLRHFFERVHFTSLLDSNPFDDWPQFPAEKHQLTTSNFKQALLACGSIPVVMNGINDIEGVPGMHRDGGILDYHLDLPFLNKEDDEGIVLYPHFYDYVIPGWFDKSLNRFASPFNMNRVVLISPSKEFVAKLPYNKIPDRQDFKAFQHDDALRVKYWQQTVKQSAALGDTLAEWIESGKIKHKLKRLS